MLKKAESLLSREQELGLSLPDDLLYWANKKGRALAHKRARTLPFLSGNVSDTSFFKLGQIFTKYPRDQRMMKLSGKSLFRPNFHQVSMGSADDQTVCKIIGGNSSDTSFFKLGQVKFWGSADDETVWKITFSAKFSPSLHGISG